VGVALGVQTSISGITATAADSAKSAMADIVIKYALRASVKAARAGNEQLAEQLSQSITYILQATKQEAITRAKAMCKAMSDNLTILTNVTTQNIIDITAAIAAYQTIQSQPLTTIQITKATATDVLPSLITTTDEAVNNMYSLLCSYFNDTNPTLVNEFALAMHVTATGVHHAGIAATVTTIVPPATTATPAEGITMKIVELNKQVVSDINGTINLQGIKAGTYHAEFSGTDMVTKTIVIAIVSRQIINVNVLLQHV
jgi:hypothetical protein